jgi:hypothetical protein
MIALTIIDELRRTATELDTEEPYAFTLIQGQRCNYLGYAVATAAALTDTVAKYIAQGYRYRGSRKLADEDAIRAWLLWANPDDGWHYRDFYNSGTIQRFLVTHTHDDKSLRNACIHQLRTSARLQDITLGITYGEDPADFRDSIIQIYGTQGHKRFLEEYETMVQLDADIRRPQQRGQPKRRIG